jgi:hypothetical protein
MGGMSGARLIFVGQRDNATAAGRKLVLTHTDPVLDLLVESIYESIADVTVVRRSTRITNHSKQDVGIEYVSSAMLYNFAPRKIWNDS